MTGHVCSFLSPDKHLPWSHQSSPKPAAMGEWAAFSSLMYILPPPLRDQEYHSTHVPACGVSNIGSGPEAMEEGKERVDLGSTCPGFSRDPGPRRHVIRSAETVLSPLGQARMGHHAGWVSGDSFSGNFSVSPLSLQVLGTSAIVLLLLSSQHP